MHDQGLDLIWSFMGGLSQCAHAGRSWGCVVLFRYGCLQSIHRCPYRGWSTPTTPLAATGFAKIFPTGRLQARARLVFADVGDDSFVSKALGQRRGSRVQLGAGVARAVGAEADHLGGSVVIEVP